MIRPIHPGLSPNVERQDFSLALSLLFQPQKYTQGTSAFQLEKWFEKKYKEKAFGFSSGRGALFAILTSAGIKEGDEVLITGFTCVAVVDAVLAIGATPVYFDITNSFAVDVVDLRKKMTKKTKAFILQHTFGISAITKEIQTICKEKKIFFIEDVAHGIGLAQKDQLLGTFGDAAIFSFGRDKAFSAVSGGMAITKNKEIAKELEKFHKLQNDASRIWVFQNLFHMVSFYLLILPFYNIGPIGKIFLVSLQKIGLLAKPIDKKEVEHFRIYTAKFPNALAQVAVSQLARLEKFNSRRVSILKFYKKNLGDKFPEILEYNGPLLRLPLLVNDPIYLKKLARLKQIYLGDWYSNGIDPKGTDVKSLGYEMGLCPTAEKIAKRIVNLPTYPTLTEKELKKVVTLITAYARN